MYYFNWIDRGIVKNQTSDMTQQKGNEESKIIESSKEIFNRDLFEALDENKFFLENSVEEEFQDLVYIISRGKYQEAINLSQGMKLESNIQMRPTGESILHICAEFG